MRGLTIGTRSVLFGYHAFWFHWIPVLRGWVALYGWPKKWWEWLAIFVHDMGYIGCRNIDGEEGVLHPERVVQWLWKYLDHTDLFHEIMLHSRRYAAMHRLRVSRLCMADKLAFFYYPRWFLLLLYKASGEYSEYIRRYEQLHRTKATSFDEWYAWARKGSYDYLVNNGLPHSVQMTLNQGESDG